MAALTLRGSERVSRGQCVDRSGSNSLSFPYAFSAPSPQHSPAFHQVAYQLFPKDRKLSYSWFLTFALRVAHLECTPPVGLKMPCVTRPKPASLSCSSTGGPRTPAAGESAYLRDSHPLWQECRTLNSKTHLTHLSTLHHAWSSQKWKSFHANWSELRYKPGLIVNR